jgi:hypothetical protein
VLFGLRRAGAVVVVSVAVSATTFVMLDGLLPGGVQRPAVEGDEARVLPRECR